MVIKFYDGIFNILTIWLEFLAGWISRGFCHASKKIIIEMWVLSKSKYKIQPWYFSYEKIKIRLAFKSLSKHIKIETLISRHWNWRLLLKDFRSVGKLSNCVFVFFGALRTGLWIFLIFFRVLLGSPQKILKLLRRKKPNYPQYFSIIYSQIDCQIPTKLKSVQ